MALLHPTSALAASSALAAFQLPPTEVSIEKTFMEPKLPSQTIDDALKFEFHVPGSVHFIDLSGTYLEIEGFFDKASNWGDEEYLYPTKYLPHALFEQVDLYLGQKKITPSTNLYPYKARLEAELFKSRDAKASVLQSAFWYDDPIDRREKVQGKKKIKVYTRLHLDLANQPKLLIPQVPVTLSLTRGNEKHLVDKTTKLQAKAGSSTEKEEVADNWTSDPSFKITKATLWVRKVKIVPDLMIALEKELLKQAAKYHIKRSEVTAFNSISTGLTKVTIDNILRGQLPSLLVFGILKNSVFSGDWQADAFKFANQNVKKFEIFVDGQQIISYEPDIPNKNYAREHTEIFVQLEQEETGNFDCTYKDWMENKCFFVANLTPAHGHGTSHQTVPPIQRGTVRADIEFSQQTTDALTLLCYSLYDNLIQMSADREVNLDY